MRTTVPATVLTTLLVVAGALLAPATDLPSATASVPPKVAPTATDAPAPSLAPTGPVWHAEAAPVLTGLSGQLYDVSCPELNFCMAVGAWAEHGEFDLLAQVWDGQTWSKVPIPTLGGSQGGLTDVSCNAPDSCIAVGLEGPAGDMPLAYQWDGGAWSRTSSPTPGGYDLLWGVSCRSHDWCVAVGDRGDGEALASLWDGIQWTAMELPSTPDATLSSVSCPLVDSCVAVGKGQQGALIERWDGTRWTVMDDPDNTEYLKDVSCASVDSCVAVGIRDWETALVETWDGTSWTVAEVPDPNSEFFSLDSVSCASETACTATGEEVVLTLTDGTWDLELLPTGPTHKLTSGVDCPAPATCFAVGFHYVFAESDTLVRQWDGQSWSEMTSANELLTYDTRLDGVSCVASTFCVAVGTDADRDDDGDLSLPLLARWGGGSWRAELPVGAVDEDTGAPTSPQPDLAAVSCVSTTSCIAVGGTSDDAVAEHWNGSSWTGSNLRRPIDDRKGWFTGLDDVSCVDRDYCVAVGDRHEFGGASPRALLAVWNGQSWQRVDDRRYPQFDAVSCVSRERCVVIAADENGPIAAVWNGKRVGETTKLPTGDPRTLVVDISCVSRDWCAAVGYRRASGVVILTWNGRAWQSARSPRGLSKSAVLNSVSCARPRRCTAVGFVGRSSGRGSVNVVLRSTRGDWSRVQVPSPGRLSAMSDVSCVGSTGCVAVGVDSASDQAQIVASRRTGARG